jgi:cytochrome c peroxidase
VDTATSAIRGFNCSSGRRPTWSRETSGPARLPVESARPEGAVDSFDHQARRAGNSLFRNEARCASCHQGPNFTDVVSGWHTSIPSCTTRPKWDGTGVCVEVGNRKYRTTPLRSLLQHAPYFHDGSAPDLRAVVNHYNRVFRLNLTEEEKSDLVEYLKSL